MKKKHNEVFSEYVKYHNPSFLAKYLYQPNHSKNERIGKSG